MKSGWAMLLAILLGCVLGGCNKEDPQGFSKVDYNKDGKIIFEELIVVFPDLTVEEFLAADADHNGVLDDKEYQRFHEARVSGKKLDAASVPPAPAKPAAEAQPAQPAKPTEEAKAPEPATASEPAKAAAPVVPAAQPAAPPVTGQTSVAPAAPAPEVVETVEVGTASPAPAPEAAKSYTVARGDTLTRIAKKFGVSAKEIMAANGMQAADHLEAGATLTIPSSGGGVAVASAAPAAVTDFVAGVFAKNASGDINGLIDCYGESVDYYKKGKSGKDVVRQDKADYFARWPERTYKPGAASVEKLSSGDLRVTVPTAFSVKKGSKDVRGQATFTFLLRPAGEGYRIVGEQSVLTQKK